MWVAVGVALLWLATGLGVAAWAFGRAHAAQLLSPILLEEALDPDLRALCQALGPAPQHPAPGPQGGAVAAVDRRGRPPRPR
jgi:hypothetical protein